MKAISSSSVALFLLVLGGSLLLGSSFPQTSENTTKSIRPRDFVLAEASRQLYLSYSAYCGSKVDWFWDCYWCKHVPGVRWVGNFGNAKDALFGYVAIADNTVEVVFRGTDNIPGWLKDADFKLIPYRNVPNALVHRGFWSIFTNVSADIHKLVRTAFSVCGPQCDNSVIVTGHSLGGALATLAAVDIKEWNTSLSVELYNFGSPRIGNNVLAGYIESILSSTYRMTNGADVVTQVPPRLFNYHHIAQEIWYKKGVYHFCDKSGEDPNCEDSQLIPSILDHATYMDVNVLKGIFYGCLVIIS